MRHAQNLLGLGGQRQPGQLRPVECSRSTGRRRQWHVLAIGKCTSPEPRSMSWYPRSMPRLYLRAPRDGHTVDGQPEPTFAPGHAHVAACRGRAPRQARSRTARLPLEAGRRLSPHLPPDEPTKQELAWLVGTEVAWMAEIDQDMLHLVPVLLCLVPRGLGRVN